MSSATPLFSSKSSAQLRRDCWKSLLCLLALLGAPLPAFSAEAEAPSESSPGTSAVTPPVPLHTPVGPLPTEGPVEVVLELTVDAQGAVTQAAALSGSEPYASAAEESARSWQFQPAQQGERAVAARIHFLVTFEPRSPHSEPEENPQSTNQEPQPGSPSGSNAEGTGEPSQPSQGTVKTQSMSEILVLGQLKEPGSVSVTRAEARNLAGAFDDPLRSLEVLPGVTPIATGLPLFFVRGAPPGNVGFFIDGIRVPQLYHGFLGPSVIHPAFLEQVTLHGGPAPTRFGRFAGGALEANLARPRDKFRGEANLRLFDAGAFVEAPFADGRGYALLGGRYSYTALLLTLMSPGQRFDYWDYQALVGYRLSPRDELSVFTFGSFDYARLDQGNTAVGTQFHRVDFRWDHRFSEKTKSRWALTLGNDQTLSQSGVVSAYSLGTRFTLEHQMKEALLRSGADLYAEKYTLELDPGIHQPEIYLSLFPNRIDLVGGAFTDLVLFPKGAFQVIPGVRADVFYSLGELAVSVDPRLFLSYQLTPQLRASHGVALAHQSPSFVPGIPGAQVGGLHGGLQRSIQASSSFELQLPWETTGSLAFFINSTTGLTDPLGLGQNALIDEYSASYRALGRAAGFELHLKRPLTRHLGGLISYTFSATHRSMGRISTIPGYDRPHVLNLALTYDLGNQWRASAKFVAASGVPGRRTTLDGFVFDQSRSSPLLRLDVKIAKRWYTSEHFYWGTHLEVLNASHTGSASSRICHLSGCQDQGTAPLTLPSIGLEMGWN